jgi:hypothetical protein
VPRWMVAAMRGEVVVMASIAGHPRLSVPVLAEHQLRSRQRDRAIVGLWPHEESSLQPLSEQAQDVFIMPLFTM